jgi:hypothetical protein
VRRPESAGAGFLHRGKHYFQGCYSGSPHGFSGFGLLALDSTTNICRLPSQISLFATTATARVIHNEMVYAMRKDGVLSILLVVVLLVLE